jgi:hypothetical protein
MALGLSYIDVYRKLWPARCSDIWFTESWRLELIANSIVCTARKGHPWRSLSARGSSRSNTRWKVQAGPMLHLRSDGRFPAFR